jgi:outer membrane protein
MKYNVRYKSLKKIILILSALVAVISAKAASGTTDTLQLSDAIHQMLQQYPTISLAQEGLNASDAKIGLARSGYQPDIDATASYTRIGPVPSFDFPGFGHILLYPEDNYVASVNVQQTIYDFGKTANRVAVEEQGKTISEQNIDLVKEQLTKRLIGLYYTYLYVQEAYKIQNEKIANLQEHLTLIMKKRETGSATDYEVLSTQVKLAASEAQKTDQESSLNTMQALLNSFLGKPKNTALVVSAKTNAPILQDIQDSTISIALRNRTEIKQALTRIKLMEMRIDLAKSENHPSIKAYVSAGGKNGYVPDIGKFKADYSAGVGLRIPIYDASRTKYNVSLAKTSLLVSQHEQDVTSLQITNEVVEFYQKEMAGIRKVEQSEYQVKQAQKAYDLASTSYKTGVITNLDLLDATTALAESRLMLLKARIDLLVGYYELQMAEGQKLFSE